MSAPDFTLDVEGASSLQRVVRARPPVHPFSCPTADCRSEWRDKELWWIINGKPVSDAALRSWCYAHLEYPWCYVDVVRAYHVNAWAYDECPNDQALRPADGAASDSRCGRTAGSQQRVGSRTGAVLVPEVERGAGAEQEEKI